MNVGLFGGSFDPPHVAHVRIAEAARAAVPLDRLIVIPAAVSPFKLGTRPAPAADRLAMTRLAFEGVPDVEVSDVEVRREGPSYTADTVEWARHRFPRDRLFLVVGGDAAAEFTSWTRWQAIAEETTLLVVARPGHTVALPPQVRALALPDVGSDAASTTIRASLLAALKPLDDLPTAVEQFIRARGLYGARALSEGTASC